MSAISNDALQKVLQEIGQKKAFSEQQLSIVRQQKVAKNREGRLLQLTSEEVKTLPEGTRVYEGVGKMFVCTPIPELQKRLSSEAEKLNADLENLAKKENYLEQTLKNSKEHLENMLRGGKS